MKHRMIKTNGVTLHAAVAGPEDGPLVILLHGFPEFWICWEKQIEFLAALGFFVVAPDQRGYNLSDKPKKFAAYNLDHLAADIAGLIRAFDRKKACLAGHDWGGNVAWWVAHSYPEWIEKLVVVNCPHPNVLKENLTKNLRQMLRSWYIFYFQMPFLPEFFFLLNQRSFYQSLNKTSVKEIFTDERISRYLEAWNQPGAAQGMINWYRALFRAPPARKNDSEILMPTLLIWGCKDTFLYKELAQPSIEHCRDGKIHFFEESSHWVIHEEPQAVSQLIADFFKDP